MAEHWMQKAFAHSHGQFKTKAKKAGKSVAEMAAHPGKDATTKTKRQANLAELGMKYGGGHHASQPHPKTNPGDYDDSAHKGEGHDRPHTEFRPEGHKETAVATAHKDMAAGVGMQPAMHFESFPNRPAAHNAHGFGHSHGQRAGDLRLSGVKGAHRIGKR